MSLAQDVCRLRTFDVHACSTSNGLKASASATNADQLQSVGCVKLTDKPIVRVIDKFDAFSKVTITTKSSIVPFWVYNHDVQCGPVSSSPSTPQFPSAYQETRDGFVWKDGSRIGWVDWQTNNYYRLDQLVVSGSSSPALKPNASGTKITSTLDAAVRSADQVATASPESTLDQTGDGFVWKSGKRIGWVGTSPPKFFRIDQIEISMDRSAAPKQGEEGTPIIEGRLFEAVTKAKKKE